MAGRPSNSGFQKLCEALDETETMSPFGQMERRGRAVQARFKAARQLLRKLSGGDSIGFLLSMWDEGETAEVWKRLSGGFPEAFNELDDERSKRLIVSGLGWERRRFDATGMIVGDKLWKNRADHSELDGGGRPTKVTPEIREKVVQALDVASSPSSRIMKKESKKEGRDVVVHSMTHTFRQAFDESGLSPEISYTTFRRLRPACYQHMDRRTDVCEVCEEGEKTRDRLKQCIAANRKVLNSAHWYAKNDPLLLLANLFETGIPRSVREAVSSMLFHLVEVNVHLDSAQRQRKVYSQQIADPPTGTVVITADFKQKGKLPMKPREEGQLYYNQGAFSLLGFGLFWKEGGSLKKLNIDVLLRTLNQDGLVFIRCFEAIKKYLPPQRKFIFWCDSGRHFRCKLAITRLLREKQTLSINFFEGGHGKNDRDQHFGTISRVLEENAKKTPISNLSDVEKLLNTTHTKAFKLRLRSQRPSFDVIDIPHVLSIACYQKDGEDITVHEFSDSGGYPLTKKMTRKVVNFHPKVSNKLPKCDSDSDYSAESSDDEANQPLKRAVHNALDRKHTRKRQFFADTKAKTEKQPKKRIRKS